MEIFFDGIFLRPWSIRDAAQFASNLRDGFHFSYSLNDAKSWLNMILPENFPPRFFAITVDKRLVSSIGIVSKTDIYRKNFEIGYFLAEEHWGKD